MTTRNATGGGNHGLVSVGACVGGLAARLQQPLLRERPTPVSVGGNAQVPPSTPQDRIDSTTARIEARLAARRVAPIASVAVRPARPTPAVPVRTGTRGLPASIQYQLFGQLAGVEIERLDAGNEFPTLLTRVPIFPPGKRGQQKALLDSWNALCFETPWGRGKRHGPPLTTQDEDTLIALFRLRRFALRADGSRLPVPINGDGEPKVVHAVYLRIGDVQKELGVDAGGRANDLRIESIKRLAATRIELEAVGANGWVAGKMHSLIEVEWTRHKGEGLVLVQFPPVISRLLTEAYSYVDWDVRRKLSEAGKAVHRFLSGQPKSYCVGADKLRTTIGYTRAKGSFMRDLRDTLSRLKDEGWLKGYAIVGTGRSTDFLIKILR